MKYNYETFKKIALKTDELEKQLAIEEHQVEIDKLKGLTIEKERGEKVLKKIREMLKTNNIFLNNLEKFIDE